MLHQCSCRSLLALLTSPRALQAARKPHKAVLTRTYTSLCNLRPTISTSPLQSSAHLPGRISSTCPGGSPSLDLQPKISSHPALASTQVRCGPRNTFSPSHFVRKRRHGFLSRQKTRKGRATLVRRRLKKRSTLSH